MTKAELQSEVRRRLDEASSPVVVSMAEIGEVVNDAYEEMSDVTEWNETWRTLDLLDSHRYYDARSVLDPGFLRIGPAFNVQTNRWLEPTPIRLLDDRDRRWESNIGAAERLMARGLWWFGFWPLSASDSGTIKQYFTKLPSRMVEDDDEPGFDEQFHYGIVELALVEIWAQDGEADLAIAAWRAYEAYEAGLRSQVVARAKSPMWHGHVG